MILDIAFLDDATRPTMPPLEGLTRTQKAAGEHLKEVHDHLRHDMQTIKTLIGQAAQGRISPADVAAETDRMAMIANFRRFGSLCGQYCQLVNTHHSIEDYHLFPRLAAISDGYQAVADRLRAEHVVVHELLERQIDALNALAAEPGAERFGEAREVFEALERVLLSHLGYEEHEIGDALGYYELL